MKRRYVLFARSGIFFTITIKVNQSPSGSINHTVAFIILKQNVIMGLQNNVE